MSEGNTARAARLAAAYSVLGVKRDRITVDERGTPYLDHRPVERLTTRVRITMLAMILLDCFGYDDVERDAILKLDANRLYKSDMAWLRKHLKDGAIAGAIRDFMELQGELA